MRSICALALLLLSACTALPACTAVDKGQRVAANALVPPADEIAIGKEMKKELAKDIKLHKDPEVQAYIDKMGKRMAGRVKSPVPLNFHVVDDDKQVNAFAIPGGDIYIFSGLLKLADDDSEVACVVGHEIAHVTERHIAEGLVKQYGIQTVLGLALGKDPGLVGQIAAGLAGNGVLLKFSRDAERDADDHGLPLCNAAGYDPSGFVRMFKKMRSLGESSKMLAFLQSHPLPTERIEDAQEQIKTFKTKGNDQNEAAYAAFKAKL